VLLLDWVLADDGSAVVADPRDPEVESPADPLLPPQVGLPEERDEDDVAGLLDQPLPLLPLNDLDPPLLPPRLLLLEARARTSPHKESTKTRATNR